MDVFIGTIIPTGFSYAPEGWIMCNGQLLSINNYQALYAVLGTRFGGNGQTTFGVPDLCGRTAVGAGVGVDSAPTVTVGQVIGETIEPVVGTGTATASIASNNLPQLTVGGSVAGSAMTATSTLNATSNGPAGSTSSPSNGAMLGNTGTSGNGMGAVYYANPAPGTPSVALDARSVTTTLNGPVTVTATLGAGQALSAPVRTTPIQQYPMQPSLALNYIMCVQGIFPTQS
jgi:microcystin-dependent protein